MPLTNHQELAAESRGGARLVSAAAGSGKTKVLVERLMRYVDRGADIDQFLVITYTRAAAAELRSRILSALGERIAADPMNRRLRRQTELCCRASIGTIDSICGRFLRENTHLAGISPDYRVIEPDRSDEICARVLDKLLEELYETIEEDAGVRALVDSFGSGDNDDKLSTLVLRLYKSLQSHADPDAWLAEQRERLTDAWNDAGDTPWGQYLLSRTRSQAQYWAERIEELRLRLDEPDRDAKIKKAYTNNLDFAGDAARDMARAAALGWDKARLACPGPFPRRGIYKGDDPLAQRIIAVWTGFKDTAAKWQELFANDSDALLRDLAVNTPAVDALLALTQKLGAAFAAEKKRQGVCDFSDQEHLVLKLLTDSSNGLAAALSSRYTEVLVDEYQDVNACQDALFRLLSDNGRKLFMVGDVKQSIYRFRLADPTIFLQKYAAYPMRGTQAPGEPRKLLLSKNFRSRAEILEAANDVFSLVMKKEAGELDYTQAEALVPGASFPEEGSPKVELHCLDLTAADDDTGDKTGAEAEFVAARIAELLNGGTFVTENGALRPARASDIVILMRSPGMTAGVYQAALQKRGIACDAGAGGDLLQTAEVEILLQLLQIIDNPRRDIPLAAAMASPVFGFAPEELARIRAVDKSADLYTCICAQPEPTDRLQRFTAWLTAMRRQSRLVDVPELLQTVIRTSGLEDVFAALPDAERRQADLAAFSAFVTQSAQTDVHSLSELVQLCGQLLERGASLPAQQTPARQDAVRIMSIHKSKGLEFPIVILADLARKFNLQDSQSAVLTDEELLLGGNVVDLASRSFYPGLARMAIMRRKTSQTVSEELRVLYVAMTRAKERLIMTSCAARYESRLQKLRLLLSDPLQPCVSAAARRPDDWILMAALCRTESGALFAASGPCDCSRVRALPWRVTLQQTAPADPAARGTSPEQPAQIPPLDRAQVEQSASFHYAHEAATRLPSKLTATQLKGRFLDAEAAEQAPAEPQRRPWRTPQFLQDRPLTGREKGSATHLFMQFVRYEACADEPGVRAELQRLQVQKFLTPRQAEAVDVQKILRLFSSPLGKTLLSAKTLRREFKFSILTDAEAYSPEAAGEQVMLQGVVDCFWQEPDGIVILDFKTDYIDGDLQQKAERYAPQLHAYAAALSRIFQTPVKKTILYFFSANQPIEI